MWEGGSSQQADGWGSMGNLNMENDCVDGCELAEVLR